MAPLIELHDLTKVYPGRPETVALRNVSMEIRDQEFVAVTGPSGSGKSTLLNIIALLDRPTSGRYLIDGEDTTAWSESRRCTARARWFGFVFQTFQLLPTRTVAENISVALVHQGTPRSERTDRVIEAVGAVDMLHRIDAEARTLSGGEQQRVAIARAIAGDPRVLLCDEPTGNLDAVNEQNVLRIIEELSRRMAVVVVTHSDVVADRASCRLDVTDGVLRGAP